MKEKVVKYTQRTFFISILIVLLSVGIIKYVVLPDPVLWSYFERFFFKPTQKVIQEIREVAHLEPKKRSPVIEHIIYNVQFDNPDAIESLDEKVFRGETEYEIFVDPVQGPVLRAKSDKTSSLLYEKIEVDMKKSPTLSWEWKAENFPANKRNEVLGAQEDNDYVARVYAMFKGNTILSSDVIQYVWDDHFVEGETGKSGFSNRVKIMVVRHGIVTDNDGWIKEERDIAEDYRQLFGEEPTKPLSAIGIMSDSDNTKTSSLAYLKNIQVSLRDQKNS